jgi:hypothetical protein
MLKKLKYRWIIFWHSLFRGMSNAESIINGQTKSNDGDIGIIQQIGVGGVFDDMLQQKETQEVVEMRDKYYRVYKESDKWDTSNITIIGEDENGVIFGNTDKIKKKRKSDFIKHPPVYNPENLLLRTIQDVKHIQKHSNFYVDKKVLENLTDFDTNLTIKRDGITPRFFIEKYAKRIVVRENNNRAIVDFYLPLHASQFGKVDAILISNLHNMKNEKIMKSDITDIVEIEWFSDKAWNSDDVCLFKYNDIKFIGIDIFDGSFVLSFDCNIVEDGKDLTEKFKTKELDEKYKSESQKHDVVDIFTYSRKMERDEKKKNDIDINNLSNTTFKIS